MKPADITARPTAPVLTLPLQIHAATRSHHARLNRLITARIPLCVPPHADSPLLYLIGIRRIAELYYEVEKFVLKSSSQPYLDNDETPLKEELCNDADSKISRPPPLCFLLQPRLFRTKSLEQDITHLSSLLESRNIPRSVLHELHPNCQAESFASHIGKVASSKPHAVLAYIWLLYMALFNGGRWMRSQLAAAGPQFWGSGQSVSRCCPSSDRAGMSFWHFDSESCGKDLEMDLRDRFLAVSERLTSDEKDDVVQQAVHVFHRLEALVKELDMDCAASLGNLDAGSQGQRISIPCDLSV